MTGQVLVLNATYEPLNVCSLRRACVLLLKSKAELIDALERPLRSASASLPYPVVIRLLSYVRRPRAAARRITRRAVFARDGHSCQYCGVEGVRLTVDHVLPRSRGGPSSWDNAVTACAPCNLRKGDRLPHEIGMRLRTQAAPALAQPVPDAAGGRGAARLARLPAAAARPLTPPTHG